MSAEPLVSAVTPVHNGAQYLSECIESILRQTYSNWDYAIVDNRSTDATLEIATRYAQRDRRIRVVTNEQFVGAIANHNRALRRLSPESKYCKVVFADDWLFPDCLRQMVEVAEANPSVAIVGSYGLRGTKVDWDGLPYPSTVVPGHTICRNRLLGGPFVFGSTTSLLLRSDVVRSREAFYDESNIHADTHACFDILRHWDFGFVHQVLTFTRTDNDGLTSASERYNTYLAGYLRDLVTFGGDLLEPDELDSLIRRHLWWYYDYLGDSLLHLREREFWEYHRCELRAAGFPLRPSRLATAVARNAARRLFQLGSWRGLWCRLTGSVTKNSIGRAAAPSGSSR